MGLVLSILYFLTYYLTPTSLFGSLAEIHIELIFAAMALIFSLPQLMKSFFFRTPQFIALIGLAIASFLSILMSGWAGGGVVAALLFLPNAFGFILVCLQCNTKRRLQAVVALMVFVCLFVIGRGGYDMLHEGSVEPVHARLFQDPVAVQDATGSTYLLPQWHGPGDWFYRLKGHGEINDPNDLGQLIVCVTPLVFIFWRPKKTLSNFVWVILPVCFLLFGIYLTHSRGALLALTAVLLVGARRRIGTVLSALIAGGLLVAALALNATAGREISAEAGSDRTALWGAGLELLKSHPLFGVGFGKMRDFADLTAHNSIIVCAAELGLIGLYFWALFLFPTFRNALAVASPTKVTEGEPTAFEVGLFPETTGKVEEVDKAEINRLGGLMVLSLTGFLVAGWFLSRAFVMTLFMLGGMSEVVFEMALRRGMIAPRMPLGRVLLFAGALAILMLVVMYLMIRILHMVG
jgi:hypothetical protein